MKTSTSLEKVSALEAQLNQSLGSRAGVVAAINDRLAKAEAVLAVFNDSSIPEGIDKAIAASNVVDGGRKLLAGFGQDVRAWEDGVRHRWLEEHFDELVDALEKLLVERSSGRTAFREAAAAKIGKLSSEVVLKDGNGASENELSVLSRQLAALESDLERREGRLRTAKNALMSFSRARAEMPNAYLSRHDLFKVARDAVASVSFEKISGPCEPGEAPVRANP